MGISLCTKPCGVSWPKWTGSATAYVVSSGEVKFVPRGSTKLALFCAARLTTHIDSVPRRAQAQPPASVRAAPATPG